MSFRVFKRTTWQINASWPNGFEPLAVPMDTCRTLHTFHTAHDARKRCQQSNAMRPYAGRELSELSEPQRKAKMLAPFYEFTET